MQRITISLSDQLAQAFDGWMHRRRYGNRSEAVRDMVRAALESDRLEEPDSQWCVASLSYVYDHHSRDLAERLTSLQHDHHDVVVSSMHVHLDHRNCLETVTLRGPVREVRSFSDALIAEPGVRHGRVNVVPVAMETGHQHHVHAHPHT
ncbi:MAG: nickel-responsive transcriptional regulator NikR [Burkholderiales bacterium]|nr:nickel-responsive transcriptional regulator NikR [Burkholderiales bacterium]